MKKALFTLLIAVVAATMSVYAQENTPAQAPAAAAPATNNLSQGQWNHGLAIGAQWIAIDLGFAQKPEDVVRRTNENYSLDDLKTLYGSRDKWVAYYNKLKAHENEGGDVDKLVSIIADQYEKGAFLKNKVKSDVEQYNASHNGDEVSTQATAQPAEGEQAAAADPTTTVVTAEVDSTAQAAEAQTDTKTGAEGGHGFLYLLSILGLLAGGAGIFLAMQARKEAQTAMRGNSDDYNQLQKQIDKLKASLSAAPHAEQRPVTKSSVQQGKRENKAAGGESMAVPGKINFNAPKPAEQRKPEAKKEEEPKPAQEKPAQPKPATAAAEPKKEEPRPALGEPRILFMAKPDEDDNFSRAAATYEPGNSIFELTTMDGKSGSFTVIGKTEANKLALLMPGDTLTRACSGNNIQSTAGKSRIVTDRAGRAQLENGKWHIVVKAIVHYE